MQPGLGDRRPRRRVRRQLRPDRAGPVVERNGVTIDGTLNLPSQMPFHASLLYANNVANLLTAPRAGGRAERSTSRTRSRPAAASRTTAGSSTSECAKRSRDASERMSGDLINEITIFVLAVFVGFEVISKVPTMLHTPLMSGTNAIHGIVLLGGLLVVGRRGRRHARPRSPARSRSCSARSTSSVASSSPTACSRCSRAAANASPRRRQSASGSTGS